MGKLIVCIEKIPGVYTGALHKHDSNRCSDCMNKIPCQYQIEDEWMKLGRTEIEKGKIFHEYECQDDSVRLLDQTDDCIYTYDVDLITFMNYFQVPRFRIIFGHLWGIGIRPVNEAAQLIQPVYSELVKKINK